jgi:hypothetical protein
MAHEAGREVVRLLALLLWLVQLLTIPGTESDTAGP